MHITDERDKTTKSKRTKESLEGKEEAREEKAMSRRKRRRQKEKDKKKIQLDKEKEGKWTTHYLQKLEV